MKVKRQDNGAFLSQVTGEELIFLYKKLEAEHVGTHLGMGALWEAGAKGLKFKTSLGSLINSCLKIF